MAQGKFIVLEGGEGAGKTEMTERLRGIMPQGTVFTRDPGGVSIGEEVRRVVLSKNALGIDAATEILLFMAARAQLIAELIAPALEAGKHVVSDRYVLSTIAYQIYGRQKMEYLPMIKSIFTSINQKCVPDLTVFLDVSPQIGLQRIRMRLQEPNRFDEETLEFHERIKEGYTNHLGEYGRPVVVDANRPMEEVWTDVQNAVQSVL